MSKGGKRKCVLLKIFRNYPNKVIYRGTLRGAKKRVPKSKRGQYEIHFI